jgi:tetratricopeptide (TPR) repeat protein
VQILQALRNIPDFETSSLLHQPPQKPSGCYNWLMPCQDLETKELIEKRLRPYFAADFDFNIGFEYSEEEDGTAWSLFNGPIGKETRLSMWPSISKLLETGGLNGKGDTDDNDFNFVEADFVEQWENIDQHIFHFVVLCSPGMQGLVASMRLHTARPDFPWEQHREVNAAGLPCVHIAAHLGRLDIVKRVLHRGSGNINQGFGANKDTVLHSAVRGNHTDVVAYLVQEISCVDQSVTDIFGLTPLQCAMKKNLDTAKLLYAALCPRDKSAMSASDLLCDLIASITHRSIDQVFDTAAHILVDRHFDWSLSSRSPYVAALTLFTQKCSWLEYYPKQGHIPSYVLAQREKERDAAIKLLHKLNDSLVPLRHCNDHGSTAILLLFEYAPEDVLEAVYNALPERRKQGETLICSSVDLDGDSAPDIAARRTPRIRNIAVRWGGDDLEPGILQEYVAQKDYRQAVELLYVQQRFKEALEYLDKIERSEWTLCMSARAYFGLQQYGRAQSSLDGAYESPTILRLKARIAWKLGQKQEAIEKNRAAYANEARCHEKALMQGELCENLLQSTILPSKIQDMIVEHTIDEAEP